jgi:hypothetical protein
LTKYIDPSGNLHSQKLLNQGKSIALNKMKEIQNNLNFIEHMLDSIDKSKEYENAKGPYIRNIKERRIITSAYFDQFMNMKEAVSEIAKIYKTAQKNELFPMLPAGNLLEFDSCKKMRYRFFIEIANNEKQYSGIEILPSGKYNCLQTNAKPGKDAFDVVTKAWDIRNNMTIIVDNIRLEKYGYETLPSELQNYIC